MIETTTTTTTTTTTSVQIHLTDVPNSSWHLNNSLDLEESFQVVDLSEGHAHENHALEECPPHDAGVGRVVDGAVDTVAHLHVFLLVFHSAQRHGELLDHVVEFVVVFRIFFRRVFWWLCKAKNKNIFNI